jgi:heptosyltransferase-2
MHQGAYYQHLVRELGIESGPLEPAVVVPESTVAAARALLAGKGWDGHRPLVAIAPGAAYGTAKRWLPRHFSRMIDEVVRAHGAQCVLLGSAADAATVAEIRQSVPRAAQSSVMNLAGATNLTMLAAVLRLSGACVSNDSGAMHLAAAVGVPVAALFGPTREYETAPLTRRGVAADVLINPVWCRPCMLRECPIDHRCMRGLAPLRVADSVTRMLSGSTLPMANDLKLSRDRNDSTGVSH